MFWNTTMTTNTKCGQPSATPDPRPHFDQLMATGKTKRSDEPLCNFAKF